MGCWEEMRGSRRSLGYQLLYCDRVEAVARLVAAAGWEVAAGDGRILPEVLPVLQTAAAAAAARRAGVAGALATSCFISKWAQAVAGAALVAEAVAVCDVAAGAGRRRQVLRSYKQQQRAAAN